MLTKTGADARATSAWHKAALKGRNGRFLVFVTRCRSARVFKPPSVSHTYRACLQCHLKRYHWNSRARRWQSLETL